MGVGELRRLRLFEEENRKLKQLVADLSLDKHILQDVLSKKVLGLIGGARLSGTWRPVTALLRGVAAQLWRLIDLLSVTSRSEPNRNLCFTASARSRRSGYDTGISGSTSCCVGRAGG